MNDLASRPKNFSAFYSQIKIISIISSIAEEFFKSPNHVYIEKIKIQKDLELKNWKQAQDSLKAHQDRTALLLSSLAHRLAEEISLAVIETEDFNLLPTPEIILMIQKIKEALKALSEKSSADSIVAAENHSLEILQIFKKARQDALKDEKSVRGLKNSEIALRFAEAANLIEKLVQTLGEIIIKEP